MSLPHLASARRRGAAVGAAALALTAVVPATVAAPGALALTFAPATAASAATIAVDRACYVRTGPRAPRMRLTGSGFEPGGQVTITDSSGTLDATTTASAAGRVFAAFAGPSLILRRPGQVADTVAASEPDGQGGQLTARTRTHISILGAGHGATGTARGLAALREPTEWVFSGWPPGRSLYVHYLLAGRAVARAAFGAPRGPCGTLDARRSLFPGRPRAARYRTQIDESEHYSPHTRPRFTLLSVGLQLAF